MRAFAGAGSAWQAQAGSSGDGDRRPRWLAGQAAATMRWCYRVAQAGSARRAPDRSGAVGHPAEFFAGSVAHEVPPRAAIRDDARPMTDRHGPPAPPGCAVSAAPSATCARSCSSGPASLPCDDASNRPHAAACGASRSARRSVASSASPRTLVELRYPRRRRTAPQMRCCSRATRTAAVRVRTASLA